MKARQASLYFETQQDKANACQFFQDTMNHLGLGSNPNMWEVGSTGHDVWLCIMKHLLTLSQEGVRV